MNNNKVVNINNIVNRVFCGDALSILKTLPSESMQMCCTSPPYWGLRDYGHDGQLGLEKTPGEYVQKLVMVFAEVKRVLRKDGTVWLNLGDSYADGGRGNGQKGFCKQHTNEGSLGFGVKKAPEGLKHKDLVGIPWMVAFALRVDGWYLRSDIIWAKPNPMPESVTDRPTKSHEYIFLLTKNSRYYYDADAIAEESCRPGEIGTLGFLRGLDIKQSDPNYRSVGQQGRQIKTSAIRNKRDVWSIATKPFTGAHFATFTPEIPEICIKAGTRENDIVLDPFAGSGTTLEVAKRLNRQYIGIELNEKYIRELVEPRLENVNPLFPNIQDYSTEGK